jgi:hypothetical protein
MENPNTSAVWIQLITTAGTILTLIITHLLTRQRQEALAQDNRDVKADLAIAQEAAKKREDKLDEVHTIVNGKSEAKDRLIAELEAHLEDKERSR